MRFFNRPTLSFMYCPNVAIQFSFMDINKAIIKNFTLHIGDKAGVKVDGVLSELPGEFTYEYVSRNFKPL